MMKFQFQFFKQLLGFFQKQHAFSVYVSICHTNEHFFIIESLKFSFFFKNIFLLLNEAVRISSTKLQDWTHWFVIEIVNPHHIEIGRNCFAIDTPRALWLESPMSHFSHHKSVHEQSRVSFGIEHKLYLYDCSYIPSTSNICYLMRWISKFLCFLFMLFLTSEGGMESECEKNSAMSMSFKKITYWITRKQIWMFIEIKLTLDGRIYDSLIYPINHTHPPTWCYSNE